VKKINAKTGYSLF